MLVDDNSVRATITAYWMKQMGWDVVTFSTAGQDIEIETGAGARNILGLENINAQLVSVPELQKLIKNGGVQVIDFAKS